MASAKLTLAAALVELTVELPHNTRLWQVDLDAYATLVSLGGASAAERERAHRMAFERDARRYLASRHALRQVLGMVMGVAPQEVRVDIDSVGKPCCAGARAVQFNLSHAGHIGLIAVGLSTRALGVDIEIIRPIAEVEALARSHFSPEERENWSRVPAEQRVAAFLAIWVRKEACLKALGVGLSAQPSSINVSEISCIPEVSVPLGERRCEVSVYAVRLASELVAAMALAEPSAVALARRYFQAT